MAEKERIRQDNINRIVLRSIYEIINGDGMVKSLIKGFFSGAIAFIIYTYLGGYVLGFIPLPPPFSSAIVMGVLAALVVWLIEKFMIKY